ncbi:calcineurin-like phosphoesterase domain-containing protein [Ditylenchus destructor]|nr:calcineurin-like phosphoesterase domain-containing protein [Ditylenchus destructor]
MRKTAISATNTNKMAERDGKAAAYAESKNVQKEGVFPLTGSMYDIEAFVRNIWNWIFQFTNREGNVPQYDQEPLIRLLQDAERIMRAEPTVIDLKEKVSIMGDLHGHGDSLVTLFCLGGFPPKEKYVFLGNYSGLGFAPQETLFLLIALKVKYPNHIYLLRGSNEDSEVLQAQGFITELEKRGGTKKVWDAVQTCLQSLPLAAILNDNFLCIHGGIGPQLMKYGITRLRNVCRPPRSSVDTAITMECQWASYRFRELTKGDGSPVFVESDVNKFCKDNNLRMIIRSRQVVSNGVLNLPERMLTVWSAASYLDVFHTAGAILKLDPLINTASIIRYKVVEEEPRSLDDFRPAGGRNSRAT